MANLLCKSFIPGSVAWVINCYSFNFYFKSSIILVKGTRLTVFMLKGQGQVWGYFRINIYAYLSVLNTSGSKTQSLRLPLWIVTWIQRSQTTVPARYYGSLDILRHHHKLCDGLIWNVAFCQGSETSLYQGWTNTMCHLYFDIAFCIY